MVRTPSRQVQPTVQHFKVGHTLLQAKTMEMAQSSTAGIVMRAIKSCRNSKAFGPEKLSIFHLKRHLQSSYRPITLLRSAAKVMDTLILPTINKYLLPAPEQHGFRPEHSTNPAVNNRHRKLSSVVISVYECQRLECAFTSPVRTESGMFLMYCMQCCSAL